MNYIVFDLEWNQPPTQQALVTEPVYLTGEIIQIGAVKLDASFKVVDELRLYIKPVHYTKMHRRIASLTGIRDKDLEKSGMSFPEAYSVFIKWCGEAYTFMTWSGSDLPMLIDNMLLHDLDVSCLPDVCDIQRIFSREIMRCDRRISLNDALDILNEQGEAAHDALHDARNTVKVCDHLDLELYIGEYMSSVFAELPRNRSYQSIRDILHDRSVAAVSCPWCGEEVDCRGWVQGNDDQFMALGACSQGDEFLLQLYCVRHQPEHYRVSRLIYEISDDLWELYQERKEAQKLVPAE